MNRTAIVRSCLLGVLVSGPLAAACGSRTGLYVSASEGDASQPDEGAPDASLPEPDAEPPFDATTEPPVDAREEADARPRDATAEEPPRDAREETVRDAREEADALPPIDATFPDASSCADAGETLVYVITQEADLYSFYPPTLTFTHIGTVSCPDTTGTPFSMAVDREGIAYVLFSTGQLFRVDTATAACTATKYAVDQDGFQTFGMGYGDQTLYVDQEVAGGSANPSKGLASIDTATMTLSYIADFTPPIPGVELTGTGDGRLFGFSCLTTGGSHIVEIAPATAAILGENDLTVGAIDDAWAFAFWGGKFWVFTSPGSTTTVTRFDPVTGKETTATTLAGAVVGAGVSTCAPQ